MRLGKAATITAGLALGAILVAPAAFAGRGWGGCDGGGPRGGQEPPCAQEQYRGDSRGGRGGYRGDCYGSDRRGGDRRRDRDQRWDCGGPRDCAGPRDCPGPRDCSGPRGQTPAPSQDDPGSGAN